MRCNWWMLELARAAAVLGALGLGSAAAFGQDDSDSDSSRDRSSQEERSDDRSNRDDSERSNRDDSERSSRDDRRDSERSTQRDDRTRREGGQQGIPSERSERREDRQSRSDREDRSSSNREDRRSDDARRSGEAREQGEEVGAEFEADDNDQLSVRNIEDGSLAARAGLRRHDRIVTVDGRRFQDRGQLEDYLRRNMARRVPIIIDRDGERYTVVLPMRRMAARMQTAQQSGPWLGVYLDDNEDGPVITHTYPQSPAQRAGLRPGDVVVQIDGEDVTDSEEVMRRIEDFRAHDQLKLTILRNDREREMTATLGDRSEIAFRQQGQGQGTFQSQGQGQFRDQGQGATWTEQPRYADTGRDARSYSRGSYSSGNEDAVHRLERMVQELREEVRELRQQMDDR